MKKLHFFTITGLVSLLFGLSGWLTAQNYQTILSTKTTTFIGNDNQQVASIRIDSSFVYGGDSVFYPFYNIQFADYDCYLPFSYSWIGKKIIIKPDGYNGFINRENDTVKINTLAQLNENWIAYEISDIIIVAEVVKHDTLSFLGQTDSAKTISFTAYNQNMDSISLPINNKTIIISENFGILKTMNFSLFPDKEVQTYDLLGMSSPEIGMVNLTWKEIYDFDIGDEIHHTSHNSEPFMSNYQKIKYVYLDKTVYSDSIIYKVDRTLKKERSGIENNVHIEETEYLHDTIYMFYKPNPVLDRLSGEIMGDEWSLSDARILIKDIPEKILPYNEIEKWQQDDGDSCWTYPIKDGCVSIYSYLKGLGGPYYYCSYDFGESSCQINYYKKGDKTWGTPLSIDNIKQNNDKLISVYPNPTDGQLQITSSELHIEKVEIYDVVGKLLQSEIGQSDNTIIIDIARLSPGLYFMTVTDENQCKATKKVVKK